MTKHNSGPKHQSKGPSQLHVTESSQLTEFKSGKKTSEIWKHFSYKTNEDGTYSIHVMAVCNYCKKEYPCSINYGTSNMRHHVFNACSESPVRKDKGDPKQSILANNSKGDLAPLHYDKEYVRKMLVEMIIRDEHPFNMVEGVGFRAFCRALNPQFIVPCHRTIATDILSLFLEEKAKLKSILSGGTRVSLTTDTWTSIQNINYMVVTAHFLDDDWNLHKRIISFCQIANHNGNTISKALEQCWMGDWGIEKVFAIALDNASANNKAIDIFKARLARNKGVALGGLHMHVKCCCHVLNLIVQDGIKVLSESVEGIRVGVKWLRSSPQRLDKFRDFARSEGIEGHPILSIDVCTRWNSTYLMLSEALKLSKVFDMLSLLDSGFQEYFKQHNNTRHPDATDWENAKEFIYFLKVFYEATIKLSASKSHTSHLVFKQLLNIQTLLNKEMNKPIDETLHKVASSVKKKFNKYWGKWEKVNRFLYLAVVLDPRYKLPYLSFQLKSIGMDDEMVKKLEGEVKQMLNDLFKEYGETMLRSNQTSDGNGQSDDNAKVQHGDNDVGEEDDDDLLYRQSLRKNQVVALGDEVERYLREPYFEAKNKKFKILLYWKLESLRFPILGKIRDVFAMPVSSVASECAFSMGSRVVDPFRSCLTPKTVEALVCTNDWLKAEGFNYYKDPTEIELEIYSTLEGIEDEVFSTQSLQGMSSITRASTQASTSTTK